MPPSPRIATSPVLREWLVIAALLSALIAGAIHGQWFWRLDRSFYDQAIRLWQRPAYSDVVIVGIDEESLSRIGRWPWHRALHAALLQEIARHRPKAIALDLILVEPDTRDPVGEALLANAVTAAGTVVLPTVKRIADGRVTGETLPVPALTAAAARLGSIHTDTEADGVLRAAYLQGGWQTPTRTLLAVEALALAQGTEGYTIARRFGATVGGGRVESAWTQDRRYLVPYAGPPGHFRTVSYIDVLKGRVPVEALRDKIVLIGMTASGLGDEFPTPVSGGSRTMAGVEIHANILQGVADGIDLREASAGATLGISLLVLIGVMVSFLRLAPRQSLAVVVLSLVGTAVGAVLAFRLLQVWLPPVPLFLALLLAYPLWSWRRLEAAQAYFDRELQRLDSEPDMIPRESLPQAVSAHEVAGGVYPEFIERRISAISAATARLRTLKRFVADSVESLPNAILVAGHDGTVMLANSAAQALLGTGTAPLAGRAAVDVLHALRPQDGQQWAAIWQSAAATGSTLTVEAKSAAGESDHVVQLAPMHAGSGVGERLGTIVSIADISPLRESERRRDEALRFLSHDMRSPQASIITLLDMYREAPGSVDEKGLLDRIGKYARRTLNLADDFLRLAKAERAKTADFQPVELAEIVADVADESETLALAKSIRIVKRIDPDEAWVAGDRDFVTRALINLMSNAVKYSPERTTVTIALSAIDGQWRIDVRDQGFGIAPENLSRLFTRFQRFHQDGQPTADGIGLGLVFVKTVTERMGGRVAVESRVAAQAGGGSNPSRGTTFSLLLPMCQPPA